MLLTTPFFDSLRYFHCFLELGNEGLSASHWGPPSGAQSLPPSGQVEEVHVVPVRQEKGVFRTLGLNRVLEGLGLGSLEEREEGWWSGKGVRRQDEILQVERSM